MDLLRRRLAWLVRFTVDCAACADWLDRFRGISRARRGLDCSYRTRCAVYFTRRCDQAPALDDSQLRPHRRRYHSAHLPAPYFHVPLAFFNRLPRHRLALLDPQRPRR